MIPMMTLPEAIATGTGVFGTLVSLALGYLVYKGSDRASQRSSETQRDQNAQTGFQQLTQEQRAELTRAYARVEAAESSAAAAKQSAEDAHQIAERCQTQQAALTQAYRELHEWASEPCPHERPPPQPPLRLAIGL